MKTKLIAILAASIFCSVPFQAQDSSARVVFKDSLDNEINAVKDKDNNDVYNIGLGQTFKAEVYVTSNLFWGAYGCAFGFGTASEQGGSDLSGDFSLALGDNVPNLDIFGLQSLDTNGGFTGSGTRPYGNYMVAEVKSGRLDENTEYKIATYQLTNLMAFGDTGTISIYSTDSETNMYDEPSTKILSSSRDYIMAPPKVNYSINSIPEPSSMMAMGCAGVGVLGDVLRRRRKKLAANK